MIAYTLQNHNFFNHFINILFFASFSIFPFYLFHYKYDIVIDSQDGRLSTLQASSPLPKAPQVTQKPFKKIYIYNQKKARNGLSQSLKDVRLTESA